MRWSLASSCNSGASSWQGTHQDAQTFTSVTRPAKIAGVIPGSVSPSTGGNVVSGAGRLVEEGLLTWDRPIRESVPEIRFFNDALNDTVTLRDMLAHRTGINRHDSMWYRSDLTREQWLNAPGEDASNLAEFFNKALPGETTAHPRLDDRQIQPESVQEKVHRFKYRRDEHRRSGASHARRREGLVSHRGRRRGGG